MRKFLRSHAYETILAVLILMSGGAIVNLMADVMVMAATFAAPLAACCALSFVAALAISDAIDNKEVKKARIAEETKLKLREARAAERENERRAIEERKMLQFSNAQLKKMLQCYERERDGKLCKKESTQDFVLCSLQEAGVISWHQELFDFENGRAVLNPEWRAFIAENEQRIRERLRTK